MKHPQININYLMYHTIGQIQIKMDIIHTQKNPITFRDKVLLYLLIKDTERKEKQIFQNIAGRNCKHRDNFGHGF